MEGGQDQGNEISTLDLSRNTCCIMLPGTINNGTIQTGAFQPNAIRIERGAISTGAVRMTTVTVQAGGIYNEDGEGQRRAGNAGGAGDDSNDVVINSDDDMIDPPLAADDDQFEEETETANVEKEILAISKRVNGGGKTIDGNKLSTTVRPMNVQCTQLQVGVINMEPGSTYNQQRAPNN